VRPIGDGRS